MPARTITVLYFAGLKDLLGRSEERIQLSDSVATVKELSRSLEDRHGELGGGRLDSVRFAVNESFVDGDTLLANGDVVALIPPVAGG